MTPPPELQALLDAYCKETGYCVTLSLMRQQMLTDIHSRGMTPDDVTAVILELKKRIKHDRKGVYTTNMLEFRNAMEPDKLEERAARLRQEQARKPKPKQEVSQQRGDCNVLDFPQPQDPVVTNHAMVADSIRSIADNLRRQA